MKMSIMSKERLYWLSQFSGWFTYAFLILVLNHLSGQAIDPQFFLSVLTTFFLGIGISHAYRLLIVRLDWLKLKIIALFPRVILTSVLCGGTYFLVHTFVSEVLIAQQTVVLTPVDILLTTLNITIIFALWSLLYFLFHFIQNYRKEEIKNLRWQALSNEVELNKLKSQLNPHFIFNSMNSIRALVDEDPNKSKDSITQLSNILRSTLLAGRKKVVPLREEVQLVKDYLSLEQTRFEERLRTTFNIDDKALEHRLPPMLLQTLVENGIKHGISKLEDGGEIKIGAVKEGRTLRLTIENTGFFRSQGERDPGIGLLNSRQRLFLLYGKKGYLTIRNTERKTVLAEVFIPDEIKKYKTLNDTEID